MFKYTMSPDPKKKERFLNVRAQAYWELRDLLPLIYCKHWPERFITEAYDIRYKFPNGKIQIEAKETMIARVGRSPDYVDSMVYAFADNDICFSKANPWIIPLGLGKANEVLHKSSIWDTTLPEPNRRDYRRWREINA